ncbi:MAG: alanine racemase, partial [Myxococcales bacterium]|nr:alanine racemase [Myxococcales bacterium]
MTAVEARAPVNIVPEILRAARACGAWGQGQKSALFHDLDRFEARLDELRRAFPADTLHAVAIKANPLVELAKVAVAAGAGLEAASWEEVAIARAAGCPPERLIFDSPAKTDEELAGALALGLWLNADSEDELRRLESLGARREGPARIGLRVNPQLREGTIAMTATAGRGSKFGVPLADAPALLRRHGFVTGLHVHAGSQGCDLALLQEAAAAAAAVAEAHDLEWLDVGGGIPVRYTEADAEPFSFAAWAEALSTMPGWGRRRLVTELGRALHAGCGWALSRIEGVKEVDGVTTAVVHLGADLLPRRAYRPEQWDHELWILDPDGHPRDELQRPCNVAGPLCFSGDFLAR